MFKNWWVRFGLIVAAAFIFLQPIVASFTNRPCNPHYDCGVFGAINSTMFYPNHQATPIGELILLPLVLWGLYLVFRNVGKKKS
ncbi:MAG: hypothetical protein KGI70_00515 [Patescibacteria group bacterium]|nr:hypothetical protein [Patescibacteria group bacterium]